MLQALKDTMFALIPKFEAEVDSFQSSVKQSCAEFEKKMELFGLFDLPEESSSSTEGDGGMAGGVLVQAANEIPTKFLEARYGDAATHVMY